jgi:hypothetical protein
MKIRHIENSKLAKLIGYNITLYPFIFYIGVPTEDVVVHEMVHVAQVERLGWFKFYTSYLWEYFKLRAIGVPKITAYMQIPYEIEAYDKQREFLKEEYERKRSING